MGKRLSLSDHCSARLGTGTRNDPGLGGTGARSRKPDRKHRTTDHPRSPHHLGFVNRPD